MGVPPEEGATRGRTGWEGGAALRNWSAGRTGLALGRGRTRRTRWGGGAGPGAEAEAEKVEECGGRGGGGLRLLGLGLHSDYLPGPKKTSAHPREI